MISVLPVSDLIGEMARDNKRAASNSTSSRPQKRLFQPSPEADVKDEAVEEAHAVNLQRICAVTVARDKILQRPAFSDILTASPLSMEDGGHKAGFPGSYVLCLPFQLRSVFHTAPRSLGVSWVTPERESERAFCICHFARFPSTSIMPRRAWSPVVPMTVLRTFSG